MDCVEDVSIIYLHLSGERSLKLVILAVIIYGTELDIFLINVQ